jgi:small subunit ribosomal protein S2
VSEEIVSIKDLLEAGVHFGHHKTKWDPRMKPYIFGERDKIYIIDLQQTQNQLTEAYKIAKETAAKGNFVLFVGTKKQAIDIIKEEAIRCEMPYISTRWLGGTLTNFSTIKARIDKLLEMEKMEQEGTTNIYSKKELSQFNREKQRLLRNLEGIKHMNRLPGLIFVIDSNREKTAVQEGNRLNIPIIALLDTNCNPEPVDYLVVGNDDAIKSIKLVTSKIADAVIEGRRSMPSSAEEKAVSSEEA